MLASCGSQSSPTISRFEAQPAEIEVGESATLLATFEHGNGRIDPTVGAVNSGIATTISPTSTQTYTLQVTGSGGPTATAQATVAVKPGLRVRILGLPTELSAKVSVEGPNGFQRTLAATTNLTGLQPGTYTVRAEPVTDGTPKYHPLTPKQTFEVKTTGLQATVSYPAPTLSLPLPGDTRLEFVLIPAGSFTMGSNTIDPLIDHPTGFCAPAHKVTFQRAFYLAKHMTTLGQYRAVMGKIPEGQGGDWPFGPYEDSQLPVGCVSWFMARMEFIPALSRLFPGRAFRLPSEAEWEYALRAGGTTRYAWGDDPTQAAQFVWFDGNLPQSEGKPRWPRVGEKPANAFGLYDMQGLLYHWCEDDLVIPDDRQNYYRGAPTDGSAWVVFPRTQLYGRYAIQRGTNSKDLLTKEEAWRKSFYCFWREGIVPDYNHWTNGFRLVLEAPEPPEN